MSREVSDTRPCRWQQAADTDTSEIWHTDCGHDFALADGTPSEHGMRYCCYCGSFMVAVPMPDECVIDIEDIDP